MRRAVVVGGVIAALAPAVAALADPAPAAKAPAPSAAPAPAAPEPFDRVSAAPAGSFALVEGCVVSTSHCPPCPAGAVCKPCAPPSLTLRQLAPSPGVEELVVETGAPPSPEAAAKRLGKVGRRVRATVKVASTGASGTPARTVLVSGDDLAACPPPPRPALLGGAEITWLDPRVRQGIARVVVPTSAVKPSPGAYLLVSTRGTLSRLSLERSRDKNGACPYAATFVPSGPPLDAPRAGDHLVVVGPVPDAKTQARLLGTGLALAGAPADLREEPLGAPPPGGMAPVYAVDVDGDAAADLATVARRKSGPVKDHAIVRTDTAESWERHQTTWARPGLCTWKETDPVGP